MLLHSGPRLAPIGDAVQPLRLGVSPSILSKEYAEALSQIRKEMVPVWPEFERANPADGGHRQVPVQVRKERPSREGSQRSGNSLTPRREALCRVSRSRGAARPRAELFDHMGVDHRRLDVGVPQLILNLPNVDPVQQ